jgi:hypothetical protein
MSESIRLHKEHGLNPTIVTCFFCGKEKNEIALLGSAYKDATPMHMVLNKEPCDECKSLMDQGVMLISVRDGEYGDNPYRTGKIAVMKEEVAQRIFKGFKGRVAFVEDSAWTKMGLPE